MTPPISQQNIGSSINKTTKVLGNQVLCRHGFAEQEVAQRDRVQNGRFTPPESTAECCSPRLAIVISVATEYFSPVSLADEYDPLYHLGL
jgi:hypothetical protein